ncbi:MAG TPA: amidase [Candidatus Acidoferrales bacterium]|nr:amidase [Candidatus Acidoferrales bacterium]
MAGEDVLYLSVRELGDRIRARKISPVELAESYLQRSESLGPKFNAYATITRDLALQQARAAEAEISAGHYRGPLHGVPYALKDLVAVEGYPTTWGARPFANQKFDYNATIVEKLNRAGSVLIGKAAMIELAGGLGYSSANASLTGPARNPWNTDRWTCGSSSGSGAVVSAALAPWAIGSDTRGSTICPGAWCGISAMRPSFGRVSRHGAMAIAWSMDKLCPMARTADDCGLILSVIAGHDARDIDSLSGEFRYPAPEREPRMPLRIGRLTNAWNHLEPGLGESVSAALKIMEQNGARVSDVAIPDGPYEQVAELTIQMEAVSAFQDLIESGRCFELEDPLGKINGYAGFQFTVQDYLHVQRVRAFLQERIDRVFDNYDVLATAGESSGASLIKEVDDDSDDPIEERAPDGVSSLCGLPALTVPCGFSKNKLPYGIQFIGRALNDHAVIAAARLYQDHTDWHTKRPPID